LYKNTFFAKTYRISEVPKLTKCKWTTSSVSANVRCS